MMARDNEHWCPDSFWRLKDYTRRSIAAKDAHQIASQLGCRLQLAVRIVKKDHIFQAENFASRPLLTLARFRNRLPRRWPNIRCIIRSSARCVSTHDIVYLPAIVYPRSNGSRTAELSIIWVRYDHHSDFILLLLAHKYSSLILHSLQY